MAFLLKLLNYLPFNGSKVGIGVILAIISAVQAIDPTAIDQLWSLLTTSPVNWGAVILIIVGLVHKWLKGKQDGVSELPVESSQKKPSEWGVPSGK